MKTEDVIAFLIEQRGKLDRAIEALQGPTKRQGRPPKSPVAAATQYNDPTMPDWVKPKANSVTEITSTAKRKPRSAAQRKAHGLRMKAYWAKRKTEAKHTTAPEPTRKKRTFTNAQRKQLGQKMKALWAKRRAEAQPKVVRAKKTATAA
jgi:hypothetical protein